MTTNHSNEALKASLFRWLPPSSQRLFGGMCGILSVAVAVSALILVNRAVVDVPYWDEWDWTPLIVSFHKGTVTFGELWRQHNEHRMFFPSLITIGLDTFGGWSQVRESLTSVAVAIVGQLFVLKLLRVTFTPKVSFPILLVDSLLMFSPSQGENWSWGFQLAWFLINTATLGSIWFLTRPKFDSSLLTAGAFCALVAAYSGGFGLSVLPAGLLALFLRRDVSRWFLFAWACFSVAVAAIYLVDFHRVPNPAAVDGGSFHLLVLVHYFFSYLGLPLGRWLGLMGSTIEGIAATAIFIASATVIVRKPRFVEAGYDASLPWFALATYATVTAALTAVGRVSFGVEQSLAGRYETTAAMFWIAIVALSADAIRRLDLPPRAMITWALLSIGFVAEAWAYERNAAFGLVEMHAARAARLAGKSALFLGYSAPNTILATLYPNTELIRYYMDILKQVGDGPGTALVHPLLEDSSQIYPVPSLGFIAGTGVIDEVAWRKGFANHVLSAGQDVPSKAILSLSGWAVDPAASVPAGAIIPILDGQLRSKHAHVVYGLSRPDVSAALGTNSALRTGYLVDVYVQSLRPGPHTIVLGAMRWDRLGYYPIGDRIKFSIARD